MATVGVGSFCLVAGRGGLSHSAALGGLAALWEWWLRSAPWDCAPRVGTGGRPRRAVVAIVTPTGFAYLPNVAMAVAAGNEIRLASRARRTWRGELPSR